MGKDASGKGTDSGAERHTGGIMSFPVCLEEKAHWEVKDLRVQAGLVCCSRKGSVGLLYSPQSQAPFPVRKSERLLSFP